MIDKRSPILWACIMAFGTSSLLALGCYAYNGGFFSFAIDDPYIHLALAENLVHGHYGVNTQDYCSPSSSIAYPWLLVPGFWLGAPQLWDLLLNVMGASLATGLLAHWLKPMLGHWRFMQVVAAWGLSLLALGILALPMTGMEHGLHVMFTLLSFLGLQRPARGQDAPKWLPLALMGCVLLRFEGIALACFSILALCCWGESRIAAITAALVAVVLSAHFIFMSHLGLPLLPSSVLTKSSWVANAEAGGPLLKSLSTLLLNLRWNVHYLTAGPALLLAILIFAFLAVRAFSGKPLAGSVRMGGLWLICAATVFAHLLAGAMGWFNRYEIYAVALSCAGLLLAYGETATRSGRIMLGGGLLVFLSLTGYQYAFGTKLVFPATHNIAEQQYVMHRFAAELYDAPVAVNDIGWVSYRNPNYVLDLWGLGSEEARRAGQSRSKEFVDRICHEHSVGLIMIYSHWFLGPVPADWRHVGELRIATPRISVSAGLVDFYSTPDADPIRVRNAAIKLRAMYPYNFVLDQPTVQ